MTDFLTADTNLPSYMMFPRFLLDMEINETAKMLYIILLDRARLSQKNEGWSDTDGHVFIYFTIEALAEVLHKSQMTVKTALAVLEKQELIFRKRQEMCIRDRFWFDCSCVITIPLPFRIKQQSVVLIRISIHLAMSDTDKVSCPS